MSWGKVQIPVSKTQLLGSVTLLEASLTLEEFASAGCEPARACAVFHGFWKHRLQFSIITQQEKREKSQTV